MTARIDRTGMRYGAWLVVGMAELRRGKRLWLCRCDCGREAKIPSGNLATGKSSGCQSCKSKTHNLSTMPEYEIWGGIKSRCHCKTATGYKNYGGRGIQVCERWRASFSAFLADVGPRPSPQHSLDRFPNNDGNYEPGNVRWATPSQQHNNKRTNVRLTFNGQERTLKQWEEHLGLGRGTLWGRLNAGWTLQAALTSPPTPKGQINA